MGRAQDGEAGVQYRFHLTPGQAGELARTFGCVRLRPGPRRGSCAGNGSPTTPPRPCSPGGRTTAQGRSVGSG
ncbi:helix-turn-helix domain-containing protein [Polymorphospora rubra]|uniref:helix-turn-helix domain-containing protein n=1 Tax=Polymorphospora rubra TaxID=338584 RepID=UPI0033E37256